MIQGKKILVASTYTADYVWHSGGTVTEYIKGGTDVRVMILSFGVRRESSDSQKQEGTTADNVKGARKKETMEAVAILGIQDIEFWDLPSYPVAPALTPEVQERLVRKIREVRPDIILAHDKNGEDVLNPDHDTMSQFVFECGTQSNPSGVKIEGTQTTKQVRLYGFEPHQTELSKFTPGSFTNITKTYEQKAAAIECFKTQSHLIEYYTECTFLRNNHVRRISGSQTYKYTGCLSNFFPAAGEELYQDRKEIIHI